jgi:hypothetical protein
VAYVGVTGLGLTILRDRPCRCLVHVAAREGSSWSARSRAAARTNESLRPASGDGSWEAGKIVFVLVLRSWLSPVWQAEWSRKHPSRAAPVRGRHDHVSGDRAAQSDDRARPLAGSCRESELARGLVTLPVWGVLRWPCWRPVPPGPVPGLRRAGARRGSAACGRSRWWRSSSRASLRSSGRWRRTPGTAWRSAPPGSAPTAARPSPAYLCPRLCVN